MDLLTALKRIRANMGPDLIPKKYRRLRPRNAPASWGNCYPAAEALYHLWGKTRGWYPAYIRYKVKGVRATHWILIKTVGQWSRTHTAHTILDPTADQFKTPFDYRELVGCGFLTKHPSKRARKLMEGK